MQDLVAVGVPDAGDELLVLQEVLQLARVLPDARPPLLKGQARVVGLGPKSSGPPPGISRATPAGSR